MEIKYEIHNIENSQGTGEKRIYIQLHNNPAMTADELSKEIQETCTVTPSDVKAVMTEICHIAIRELSSGNRFLPARNGLSVSVGGKHTTVIEAERKDNGQGCLFEKSEAQDSSCLHQTGVLSSYGCVPITK